MIAAAILLAVSSPLAALPLGEVTDGGAIDCPMNAPQGASCRAITVQCPGIADLAATVAIVEPEAAAKGTVVIHGGGTGMGLFDNGFPAAYTAEGLRTVQIGWAAAWEGDGFGIKAGACRPATAFRWAFDELHAGDLDTGFCTQGHSAGSAAIAYALAHYGLEDTIDFAIFSAGPVFGRIDYGCEPDLFAPGSIAVCPELPTAFYRYGGASANVDGWMGTQTCGEPYGDASQDDIDRWASNSIVSDGADYDYPQTSLAFWECATNPNETPGLGTFYIEQLASEHTVTCQVDGCMGEPTWPGGFDAMIADMNAGCVPRHGASGTDDGGSSTSAGDTSTGGSTLGTDDGSTSSASTSETGAGSSSGVATSSTGDESSSSAGGGANETSGCGCNGSAASSWWFFALVPLVRLRTRTGS